VLVLVWVEIARRGLRAPAQSAAAPAPERNST